MYIAQKIKKEELANKSPPPQPPLLGDSNSVPSLSLAGSNLALPSRGSQLQAVSTEMLLKVGSKNISSTIQEEENTLDTEDEEQPETFLPSAIAQPPETEQEEGQTGSN